MSESITLNVIRPPLEKFPVEKVQGKSHRDNQIDDLIDIDKRYAILRGQRMLFESIKYRVTLEFKLEEHSQTTVSRDIAAKIQAYQKAIEESETGLSQITETCEPCTPEQLAEKILGFILPKFEHFKRSESRRTQDESTRIIGFYDMARKAIEDGFAHARAAMGSLPGDVEASISKTRELVLDGLDSWKSEKLLEN